jgi:hypothetical protein
METAMKEAEVAIPVTRVKEGTAPELEAATTLEVVVGAQVDALPGASTEVVMRSPEIQDAMPICLAPMAEATSTSLGGLELLADDLNDPTIVAQNLESMCRTEQWMKVRCRTFSSRIPSGSEYSIDMLPCEGCRGEIRQNSNMLQGYGDTVLRTDSLEKELDKAKKHSALLQSKLDGAFTQYHNEV